MGLFSNTNKNLAIARESLNGFIEELSREEPDTLRAHECHEDGINACKKILGFGGDNFEAMQIRVTLNHLRFKASRDKDYRKGTLKRLKQLMDAHSDKSEAWEFKAKVCQDLCMYEEAEEAVKRMQELENSE